MSETVRPREGSTGDWRISVALFVVTLLSVFGAGRALVQSPDDPTPSSLAGWPFAVPFLAILVCHEFGHWVAARLHQVPASLPYFIPLPVLNWFGTLGAIILMPERIRSRQALLDIGAAGPLAGMVVAVPTMVIGLSLSEITPINSSGYIQEGQSLLYWLIKRWVLGPMAPDHDVLLHPTALAAWGGFFITMINLLPWGQLDGGHVAFALLGERYDAWAPWLRRSLLVLFAGNLAYFLLLATRDASPMSIGQALGNSSSWLIWFVATGVMSLMGGAQHPRFEPAPLSPARRLIAAGCLLLFVLLFMPTPIAVY